ncbi:uncharacterized protein [Epargyreus clarus]|uniref:uncharacterized protein n=1 Tax=Epargyreus clarus TaxID=520877 RepID=UPI003C2D93A2
MEYSMEQYTDLCRVCVAADTKMIEIFSTTSIESINVMIQFCTGVLFTKDEGSPSKICSKCLEELHTAYKFKNKCLDSEFKFQNTIIKKIKEEPDSPNVNVIINDNDDNDITSNDKIDDVKDSDVTDYDSSKDVKDEDVIVDKCVRKSKRVRKKNSVPNKENQLKPVIIRKTRGPYKKTNKPRIRKYKFRKLYCETCNIKFKNKKDSDDHKKQFHNEPQIWMCEVCGKTFSYRTSHHSHMRSHYAPQFACEHCDYKSTAKHDLAKHVMIHTGHKSYICPICACAYRTSSNLHSHVRLVHERVRRYACPLCARAFFDRTKLNRHVDSHNDVKRYSCEVCHACFSRRCYWKKHLQRQHDILVPAQRPGRRRGELRPLPTEA